MKRAISSVLLLGIVGMFSSAGAQVATEADTWGEAIEGVQMRLALATAGPPALPGEIPALAVQIRNQGPNAVALRPEAILHANIEIDGVWYAETFAMTGSAMPVVIAPGSQSNFGPIRPNASRMSHFNEMEARAVQLELRPGPHFIRIGNARGLSVSELRQAIEKNLPALAERMAGRDLPALISNRIAIDVPTLSASSERDALAAQASEGGFEGLQPANRLVVKYPDAALPAIEKAIAATTDAAWRAQYVALAGTIPGDAVIPFLLTQAVSAADMVSRIRAADALLARGRKDGLWQLMDSWGRVDRDRARADDQARLLEFLVRSGEPQAIEHLGRAAGLSADVRLAIVVLFMPYGSRSKTALGDPRGAMFSMGVFSNTGQPLPGGAAGAAAAEQFLGNALEDTRTVPMEGETAAGVIYHFPRVCDMAALALSLRWPDKYAFTWSTEAADRDRQIALLRKAERWRLPR